VREQRALAKGRWSEHRRMLFKLVRLGKVVVPISESASGKSEGVASDIMIMIAQRSKSRLKGLLVRG
jgi:hypothetical protein